MKQPVKPKILSDFIVSTRTLYLSFLCLIVGIIGAFVAVILMKMIGFFTNLLFYHKLSFAFVADYPNSLGITVIAVPVIGGLIIGLMARYGSEKIRGHGIPEAMEAILLGKSVVSPKVAILKPISAALSIGSGGPFGAEGPIIMTGGSIGSVIGQFLNVTASERKILLLSGAAAGMCATFNAPIASVLFVTELLAFEMRPRSVVPIGIASGAAAFVRSYLLGNYVMFPSHAVPVMNWQGFLVAILFGFIGAALAYVLTKFIYGTEDLFHRLPIHWMWWPAIGAIFIGIGGYFVPQILGVGYDSIQNLVVGQLGISLAIKIVIVKTIVWILALGSGTSGGILAPLLIIGGACGDVLAIVFHDPHIAVWSILGMAAVFCGVTRSPFTTVIFLLELTHDMHMLLPTLITCAISSGISAIILPRSILTEKIARRNVHVNRDYIVDPLELRQVSEIMSSPLLSFSAEETLEVVVEKLLKQNHIYKHDAYPVIGDKNELVGILTKSNLFSWAIQPEHKDLKVCDIVPKHVTTVLQNHTGKDVVEQMIYQNVDRVVVTDENLTPIGFVTYNDLLRAKRKYFEDETIREKHFKAFNQQSNQNHILDV